MRLKLLTDAEYRTLLALRKCINYDIKPSSGQVGRILGVSYQRAHQLFLQLWEKGWVKIHQTGFVEIIPELESIRRDRATGRTLTRDKTQSKNGPRFSASVRKARKYERQKKAKRDARSASRGYGPRRLRCRCGGVRKIGQED